MPDSKQHNGKPLLSIANRLTAHYLVSAILILSLTIGLIYWGVISSLKAQSINYMKDEIYVVQEILNTGSLDVLNRKIRLSQEKEFAKLHIRVLDANGVEIAGNPLMDRELPASMFHQPDPVDSPRFEFLHVRKGDKTYLIESIWLHMLGAPRIIHMGLDVSNIESFLPSYSIRLFLVLLLGILLSGLSGRYIARKGLQPVADLASRSRLIRSPKLDERFTPQKWPLELYELTVALDEMLDRFQTSFERLRNYSSNLAHELRSPINNLMGETEITLARDRSVEEYQNVLESSLEEYHRLARTIESLLFLAWADSHEVKLKLTNLKLDDEIRNLHEYYSAGCDGRAFLIMCDPETIIFADPVLFKRALSNLITNAIKYSPDDKLITIEASKQNHHVSLSVADHGDGIPPEHLERIFDRFYRVPTIDIKHPKGSGLGLSIVKSIMELHGGSVRIESEMHKGTKVILEFPNEPKI